MLLPGAPFSPHPPIPLPHCADANAAGCACLAYTDEAHDSNAFIYILSINERVANEPAVLGLDRLLVFVRIWRNF